MKGMFLGVRAPYGYKKDPNDKNKLIIDPEPAKVVRHIYDLLLSGYSTTQISRQLAQDKIFTPAVTKLQSGDASFQRYIEEGYECRWGCGRVYKILTDPAYTGAVANSKVQVTNYKTKTIRPVSRDKWIVVPDKHEAIITQEEFERARKLIKERNLPKRKHNAEDLFKGLVKCAVCGKSMVLTQNPKRSSFYRCFGIRSIRCKEKHWTSIRYQDLKEIVAERLKEFFALFKNDDKLLDIIQERIKEQNISADCEKELSKLEARQNALSNITKKVYDDYFENLISHETYLDLIKKYQTEQSEIKEKHNILSAERTKKNNYLDDIKKLKELVHSFLDLKELTREMVYSLIDKIEITSDGDFKERKQRTVKITYRFLEIEL